MQRWSEGDRTISISVSLIWEFLAKWNMCIYASWCGDLRNCSIL